ncbi:MAG: DUF4097 family beta strand repeat-containing protein [Erysipelotrichaceae bacterium]
MTNRQWLKLIGSSILIVLLVEILLVGIRLREVRFDSAQSILQISEPLDDIQQINIDVLDFDVQVQTSTTSARLEVYAPNQRALPRVTTEKGVLSIKQPSQLSIFHWFSLNNWNSKIVLTLPTSQLDQLDIITASGNISLKELAVNAVLVNSSSGDVSMQTLAADTLEIENVSGDLSASALNVKKLVAATTSGDIRIQSTTQELTLKSISGDIQWMQREANLDGARFNTISGDISLQLQNKQGFTLSYTTISGNLSSNVPLYNNTYLDDATPLRMQTTSGDMVLNILP